MSTPLGERHDSDDIDRELEKLRGFGSTLIALSVCALLIASVSTALWMLLF